MINEVHKLLSSALEADETKTTNPRIPPTLRRDIWLHINKLELSDPNRRPQQMTEQPTHAQAMLLAFVKGWKVRKTRVESLDSWVWTTDRGVEILTHGPHDEWPAWNGNCYDALYNVT